MKRAVVVIALVVGFASGCGGGMSAAERREAIRVEADAITPLLEARVEAHPRAKCEALVGDFVASVQDLTDRWAVLTFDEARQRSGDILSVLGRLTRNIESADFEDPADKVKCLTIAQTGIKAMLEVGSRLKDWELINQVGALIGESENSAPVLLRSTKAKLDKMTKMMDAFGPPIRKGSWSTEIPRTDGEVDASVFGGLSEFVCSDEIAGIGDLAEPCTDLQDVLSAGVSEDEEGDLYNAMRKLNDAREGG